MGVLKGVAIFYADMIRQIKVKSQIDFMWISSYQGTDSGKMTVNRDVSADLKGRHVVILEDIFDTGNSLDFTYKHLLSTPSDTPLYDTDPLFSYQSTQYF